MISFRVESGFELLALVNEAVLSCRYANNSLFLLTATTLLLLVVNQGSTTLYMLVSDAANHPLGNETLFSVGTERKVPMRLEVWVMNAQTGKADEAADYIRAAMAATAPEFAPALYEEYDYVALLRASLDRDIEAQKEQNEAQSVIDELIRLRDAGEADGRYYSREQLERYRTEVAPYLIFPSCGYVDGWTPANSYMKGKLDMDGLIAELNNR